MATFENPFMRLKARLVVLGFFAIAAALTLISAVLGTFNLLPLPADDPLLAAGLNILLFSSLCLAVLLSCRQTPLSLRFLLGALPSRGWREMGLLVPSIFGFALGALQISYLLLSLVAPATVETTLRQTLQLSVEESSAPGLYNVLIVLSALVVTPITEEFLFRGVLLHRWSTKWGVRAAVVLTSIIFGVLHGNLVGLFPFGVVMSLLYLRSRSLVLPMVAHALNNAIASALEFLTTRAQPGISSAPLADFRASWWLGILCISLSAPWLFIYIRRHWPPAKVLLPYFANQAQNHQAQGNPP